MGREKKRSGPGAGPGAHAKERHKKRLRAQTVSMPSMTVLNARPEAPNMKSKHRSYYELVENKDKKKKLEFQITSHRTPPPGFEFVPIGNPELTSTCKELSRKQDAMIFIVSNGAEAGSLSQQINRVGHHIRQAIVEEARKEVSDDSNSSDDQVAPGVPEPIPETQEEINEQADLAIRDLFPRIPNTDRQTIIEHSFKKGATKKGEPLVGLAKGIPLSRRVQLAVLAHIRHTHTRYDSLLKETTYVNARKAVEKLCLDVLVKWRGDEETGRDQLDEILREVIVISDSEGEDDGGEDDEADSSGVESGDLAAEPSYLPYPTSATSRKRMAPEPVIELRRPRGPLDPTVRPQWRDESVPVFSRPVRPYMQEAPAVHRARRGFKRYEAALSARWGEAVDRVRHQKDHPLESPLTTVEYPIYARHEPPHEEQRPSPGDAFYTCDAQDSLYHRDAHNNDPHPLDLPTRGPIPALSAAAHQRSLSGGLSRGASPYADPRQAKQPQRVLVRSGEARDFLVPSVEPLSPSTEQFSAPPVFIRTVSPRQVSRPPRGFVNEVRDQFDARDSPSWGGEPASFKRRRVVDDESYPLRDPPRQDIGPQRRLVNDERQRLPVQYAVTQSNDVSPHIPSERDPRTHFAHPPVQPLARIPVPGPEGRSYYDGHRVELPLVSERAPVVLDDWDREPSPVAATFPVRDYRGNAISERREPPYRIVEAREDNTRYAPVVEYRRIALTDYDGASGRQDMPPYIQHQSPQPQDTLPIRLGPSLVERHGPYDKQPPFTNPSETRPTGYNPPVYSAAPSHFQHQGDLEPAPVFVRQVERYDQSRVLDTRGQLGRQYNPRPTHDFETPRPAGGTWAQPQTMALPHSNPYDATVVYPPYPTEPVQRPPGDYVYRGYQEHHNQQYNQRGP